MSRTRHEQVSEVFAAARRLDDARREAYLDEACAGDAALRLEVQALLDEHEATCGVLDTAAVRHKIGAIAADTLTLPRQIGQYRIVRLIGEGGMGAVYEAEQDDPRRRVALKVIRRGVVSRQLLARFRHEAQVLGQLQHPGIAQIYEAGTSEGGDQPYFAMELITGRSLLDEADARGLRTRERLDLIARICDALHHAHQKGVIHRDLKPPNILIDETGQPKVLDFGVARATDADIQTVTVQTDVGELVGTVPYMSPEQASGNPAALDIRSDLYSVGVITFELLGGRLPYDVAGKAIHEAVRVIREEEPSRLSSVNRVFRGDVETIVAKMLEKDKQRRYQSAAELAADIRRYLSDQPIVARPASTIYQIRKFAKRNKAVVTSTVVLFVMLVSALAVVTSALATASRDRDTAQRQATITEAVNDFLNNDLLAAVDPRRTTDRDLTVREVLDAASERIEGKFPGEPLVEASIRLTLGETYIHLSEYDAAEQHLARALQLRRAGNASAIEIADAQLLFGMVLIDLGRFDEAEKELADCVETCRREVGVTDPRTLDGMNNLAAVYYRLKRYEEAEPV
jgi:serine/threonine protein kinase